MLENYPNHHLIVSISVLKAILFVLLIVDISLFWHLRTLGKRLKTERRTNELYRFMVREKIRWVIMTATCMLVTVSLIEILVQLLDRHDAFPWLFPFHFVCAVIFLMLFVLLAIFNGHQYPRQHREIIPWLYGFGWIILVTGGYMLVVV